MYHRKYDLERQQRLLRAQEDQYPTYVPGIKYVIGVSSNGNVILGFLFRFSPSSDFPPRFLPLA